MYGASPIDTLRLNVEVVSDTDEGEGDDEPGSQTKQKRKIGEVSLSSPRSNSVVKDHTLRNGASLCGKVTVFSKRFKSSRRPSDDGCVTSEVGVHVVGRIL